MGGGNRYEEIMPTLPNWRNYATDPLTHSPAYRPVAYLSAVDNSKLPMVISQIPTVYLRTKMGAGNR